MASLTPAQESYARMHASSVLGTALAHDAAVDFDQLFRELSRTPELEVRARDAWGNWDYPFGESNLRGELYRPWLDRPLAEARARIAASRPDVPLEPLWPEGRPFAVCLTHDVDHITLNPPLTQCIRSMARDGAALVRAPGDRANASAALHGLLVSGFRIASLKVFHAPSQRSYDEWLKLEDRFGFRSTFFVFPETVQDRHVYDCHYAYDDPTEFSGRRTKVREMIREIATSGWDIGLHGSYHSATREGMLAEQRRQIEDVSGGPVTGTRQHWLHYDVMTTPRLQADAGLTADSTQGFNRNVGFRAGTSFPYLCWDFERDAPLPLLEIPQHVMDGALFTSNALEYDVDLAVRHCVHLLDEVEAVGGCLTLNWHPNSIEYPAYWSVYETVLAEVARRQAWGCSMRQVYEWWTGRAARIVGSPQQARS